jgi:hypothetical protein
MPRACFVLEPENLAIAQLVDQLELGLGHQLVGVPLV